MEKLYRVPYKYRFRIDKQLVEREDGKYIVYYKGKKHLLENVAIECSDKEKITREEFAKLFKGTKGITEIEGDFK